MLCDSTWCPVSYPRKEHVSNHLRSSRALTSRKAWMHSASSMKSCTSARAARKNWMTPQTSKTPRPLNTKASRELERHSLRFLVFRFLLATRAERLLRKIHLVTRSLRTASGPWTPAYKKASRALAGPRQCFQQTSHRSDCDWPRRSSPLEQSKLLWQTKPLRPEARLPSRPARHTCRPPRGSSACVTSPRIPLRLRRA